MDKLSINFKVTKWVDAKYVEPVNDITNKEFYTYLVKLFEEDGESAWGENRPILVYEGDNWEWFALTGSHRILAARKAGIKVPIYILNSEYLNEWLEEDEDNEYQFFGDTGIPQVDDSNVSFLKLLKEIGDKEAVHLYSKELEENMKG